MQPIAHLLRFIVVTLTNVICGLVAALALVLALFGCTPTIYVEPANVISFAETLQIESVIEARHAAHDLAANVRGDEPKKSGGYLEPMHWPEAFALTENSHVVRQSDGRSRKVYSPLPGTLFSAYSRPHAAPF